MNEKGVFKRPVTMWKNRRRQVDCFVALTFDLTVGKARLRTLQDVTVAGRAN